MDRLGLVGLPNSGKSSLFNALTGGEGVVAAHPFSTTETTLGVAQVPDERLAALAAMSQSRKIVPATFEVVDIAGVRARGDDREGLGGRFLAGAREVDALLFVLRGFSDAAVPGEGDPAGALRELELELVLSDVVTLENQLAKKRKPLSTADEPLKAALAVAPQALEVLEEGTPLYRSSLRGDDKQALAPLFLLSNKAVLAVVNIGEDDLGEEQAALAQVRGELGELDSLDVLAMSVKLEAEASRLEPAGRAELLEGLGLGEGALVRVARAAYGILGRDTFLTTGDKESRAWTFRRGARAPECAGVIHSDLERGFIKADVIFWSDLVELGSFASARARGKVRLEGKDYVVKDGDVLEIRFNV
ncbi:MAG: redox-regulated ATPase YchF [Acidimicrobiales bacterium]